MDEAVMVMSEKNQLVSVEEKIISSAYLEREVLLDIYQPMVNINSTNAKVLLINDGQDLRTMNFASILNKLYSLEQIEPIICIGIHCSSNRINEYGTICQPDFKNRGNKAGLYNKFVLDELIVQLQSLCKVSFVAEISFAGFSLGALSALDNVWNFRHIFSKAGVFSGALWWRKRGYDDIDYNAAIDRIMHMQIEHGNYKPGIKFFLECGQLDEVADRNNNGIIDSIDDANDLIYLLKKKGYTDDDIRYVELTDGKHDIETWAKALPTFLRWGWGIE